MHNGLQAETMRNGAKAGGSHRMGEMCNGKAMQPPNKGLAHPEPEVAQNNRGDAGHVARRSRKAVYRNMLRHPCHLRGVHPPTSQRMCRRTTMG